MPSRQYVNIIIVRVNILAENLIVVSLGMDVIHPMTAANVEQMSSMKGISGH